MSPAAGRWFVTPHAVRQYRLRCRSAGKLTYEEALADLVRMSEAAHRVKELKTGIALYRGPRPHRLRFIVAETPNVRGNLPQLITCYGGKDRGIGTEDHQA